MTSPLETSLTQLLDPKVQATVDTLKAWNGHFGLLADPQVQRHYSAGLVMCKRSPCLEDYRLCVPISRVKAKTQSFLNLKCHGRKVGTVGFACETSLTFKPEKGFAEMLKPPLDNASHKRECLETFEEQLASLPHKSKFQDVVKPEWKVEAWLLDFLSIPGPERADFQFFQPVRYPQKADSKLRYDGMFLQFSVPLSASDKIPKLSKTAHTDILVRIGRGGRRLGILEVKALKKGVDSPNHDPNITKALKQAFCYAFCYHQVFTTGLLKSGDRQRIVDVLGFGRPEKRKPLSLTAVAVVPDGSFQQVLKAANAEDVNLGAATTVISGKIKLEIWEYASDRKTKFKLTKRHYLRTSSQRKLESIEPAIR